MTAENKNLKKDYTSIFKNARAAVAIDIDKDKRPFDMARLNAHKKNIDTALLAANFQEIKPPLSAAGALRTMVTACKKPGHTVPNCPTKKTTASLHLAEKRKAAYIIARDTRRTVRAAENLENAESALLAMAESVPNIHYDTDTDNEQDEDEDDEI